VNELELIRIIQDLYAVPHGNSRERLTRFAVAEAYSDGVITESENCAILRIIQ
jgi:hypothetical protein